MHLLFSGIPLGQKKPNCKKAITLIVTVEKKRHNHVSKPVVPPIRTLPKTSSTTTTTTTISTTTTSTTSKIIKAVSAGSSISSECDKIHSIHAYSDVVDINHMELWIIPFCNESFRTSTNI